MSSLRSIHDHDECRDDADSLNPGSCETAVEEDAPRGLKKVANDVERPDTRNVP